MTIIMNIGRVPLQVGVVNTTTGAKSTIRVMGRSRGSPTVGWEVDPNWMAIHGKDVKLVDDTAVVATVKPIHGKTNSSKVKERSAASAVAAQASATLIAKTPPVVPKVAPATTAPTVPTKGAAT
jgi:hypothetical protein